MTYGKGNAGIAGRRELDAVAARKEVLFNRLYRRLCDALCGDCFFNRDASLEIDWLTVENERLKAKLQAAGLGE